MFYFCSMLFIKIGAAMYSGSTYCCLLYERLLPTFVCLLMPHTLICGRHFSISCLQSCPHNVHAQQLTRLFLCYLRALQSVKLLLLEEQCLYFPGSETFYRIVFWGRAGTLGGPLWGRGTLLRIYHDPCSCPPPFLPLCFLFK